MHGLLYYPVANLFKDLFSLPVSLGENFATWVPVLCFPLHNIVVTSAKRFKMHLDCCYTHV